MERLGQELVARGLLEAGALELARGAQAARGGALTTVLLELDLLDEETLQDALAATTGLQAARPADLARTDPAVAARFP